MIIWRRKKSRKKQRPKNEKHEDEFNEHDDIIYENEENSHEQINYELDNCGIRVYNDTVIPRYSERVGAAKCVHYNGDSL